MKLRQNFRSIGSVLLRWFILLSLVPLLAVSWYVYDQTFKSIMRMQEVKLEERALTEAKRLEGHFAEIKKDLSYWAQSPDRQDFLRQLMSTRNGRTSELFVQSDDYQKLDKSAPAVRMVKLKSYYENIYDVFLIDMEGDILYTVAKETDLGTNLQSGPYASTRFAKAFRETLNDGQIHFSDMERYSPSKGIIAGFMTAPMYAPSGEMIGVLALQLNMNAFLEGIAENHNGFYGYLVGEDGLLRSKRTNPNEVLEKRISSRVFWNWYDEHVISQKFSDTMEEGAILYVGPDGNKVLGQHHHIEIMGVKWSYISEVDEAQIMKEPNHLVKTIAFFVIMAVLAVIMAAIMIARRITKPIRELSDASLKYMGGEKGIRVDLAEGNEIGEFGSVFNALIEKQEVDEEKLNYLAQKTQKTLDELKEQKYALDAHAIVAITDVQGTITFVNSKFEEISGYKREELLAKNHRILNSGVHTVEFWKEMYHTVSHGDIWHGEVCNVAKDGHFYWVDTTIVPFMGENGKPQSYIAIRTDITERKKIEEQLIEAKELAESSVRVKSEFLATMSHEIRTPMNGVLGMLGLLSHSNLDETQRHQIRVASNSATSLLGLINDILDFSKVEAGKMQLEMIEFNLRDELGEFVEAIAFRAQEKGLELILDTTHLKRTSIITDPGRLRQILTNLVGNAVKFTHRGEILITVRLDEVDEHHGRLRIDVRDSGIGIAADKVDNLFQSFSQADNTTTRKYGGTGLGLAIVKKLCELMDGKIWVTSAEYEGSTFHVDLGIELGEISNLAIPSASVEGKSVLVVDDNETNRAIVRAQLEQWGMVVYEAEDPIIAFDYCQIRISQGHIPPYDVALLDMQMPNMDGADLGTEIRNVPQCDGMKMVMMTSLGARNDAKRFAQIGFDAFFAKPTTAKDLLKALKVLFDDGAARDGANPLVTKDYLGTLQDDDSEVTWPANTRILLVEDNPTNQIVAQGMLEMIGLEADAVNNGLEALEAMHLALETVPYTLILMDCQMPEMDGYAASTAIRAGRAGEIYKEVPIVAMTANAMAGDREKCLISGMSDYVSKPINLTMLKAMLIKWLHGEVQSSPIIREHRSRAATEDESQAFKVWDEADALKRLGGKKELLQKIMQSFVNESPNLIEALKAAITSSDLASIQLHSHSIKGSAGNVSAQQLKALAKMMEFAAKNGDKSVLKEGFVNLEKAMREVCTLFEKELTQEAKPIARKKRLDPLQMAIKLQNLKKEIENGSFIDTDALNIFGEYADEVFTVHMNALKSHIDRFDTPEALALLETIMAELE